MALPALLPSTAAARGGYNPSPWRQAADEPCGFTDGALPDPAVTRACLARRFAAARAKPKPPAATPPAPPGGAPPQ